MGNPQPKWTYVGDMNKRMTVYSLDQTRTDSGGTDDTPTALFKIRAKITPLRGRERFLEHCQFRTVTHRLNLVFRGDITAKMYATYDDRTFEFTSVINIDEENRETEIMAIETV